MIDNKAIQEQISAHKDSIKLIAHLVGIKAISNDEALDMIDATMRFCFRYIGGNEETNNAYDELYSMTMKLYSEVFVSSN